MDSSCLKQTVSKVLNIFQRVKYLVAYVLIPTFFLILFMDYFRQTIVHI